MEPMASGNLWHRVQDVKFNGTTATAAFHFHCSNIAFVPLPYLWGPGETVEYGSRPLNMDVVCSGCYTKQRRVTVMIYGKPDEIKMWENSGSV